MMSRSSIFQWLSLVGIIWLQSFNGTNTDFAAYSSQLKQILSISQVQLNNLAFASDAGKIFGWFSGFAAVYLPLPIVLLIGSILGLIGYGFQYLFIIQKISFLSYWHIFLLNILAGNSICWINTVCYMTIIRNFSFNPQVAVGLSTSYVGLSAKVYTVITDAIASSLFSSTSKAKSYLLLNSITPMLVSLVTIPVLGDVNKNTDKEKDKEGQKQSHRVFTLLFLVTILTGVYSVVGSLGWKIITLNPIAYAMGLGALLVIPLMIPIVLSIQTLISKWSIKQINKRIYDMGWNHNEVDGRVEVVVIEVKEEGLVVKEHEDSTCSISSSNGESEVDMILTSSREEIGVMEMVKRVEFWLYFFVYMFGATLGLVFMNNLGQIAESCGLSTKASSLVSLSSSFGFFGRLLPSLLQHFAKSRKYMGSTTSSMVTLMVPIAVSFLLLVINTSTISLYISTVVIGVCTGAFTSLTVPATTDLFGTKNFGVNHNIVVANIPIGSFAFGYSAAILYQIKSKLLANDNGVCIGAECYRTTFLIWGFFSSLGTVLAFILYFRTRKFYSNK